jgi:hypothetical protein
VKLLASAKAAKMKETELLADCIRDVFGATLGYTGRAGGSADYILKRESLPAVPGKVPDAALGRFSTGDGPSHVAIVIEGKGPANPLDHPFKNRRKSAVDQALG